MCVCVCTWKTLGADTRQANAEDSVAPNIPAVMSGEKADTMLIDYRQRCFMLRFNYTVKK